MEKNFRAVFQEKWKRIAFIYMQPFSKDSTAMVPPYGSLLKAVCMWTDGIRPADAPVLLAPVHLPISDHPWAAAGGFMLGIRACQYFPLPIAFGMVWNFSAAGP